MATWAIGDVHGCYRSLRALLRRRAFDRRDRLWFVGDLVNRGPRSAECLRFVADLGERATAVLGNHDLHFLAIEAGATARRGRDTLEDLLEAPDREALTNYLRTRPLLFREGGTVLVHAGLPADWTPASAERQVRRAKRVLGDPAAAYPYLESLRPRRGGSSPPPAVDPGILDTIRRLTLLRTVRLADGEPVFEYTGTLAGRPADTVAWFDVPARRSAAARVVFGHWAALGLMVRNDAIALDTGCAWGGSLTAIRLDDLRIEQTENVD